MGLYEFPRTARLLTASDFRKVFDHVDAKVSCPEYTLLASKSDENQCKIGFIVAKKQVKTAVQRNRIKRHFREQFRLFNAQMHPVNFNCIVLARHSCQQLTGQQLQASVAKQLKRLQKRMSQPVNK